ncbi:hypothetical protein HZP85_15760 [Elizabethkingia anophelis]|nr:hypothetical protein [Elizabethkingia anophelis]
MKIYKNILHVLYLAIFLHLLSCRSTDTDSAIQGGGIAQVKINLLGSDFAGELTASQASLNSKTLGSMAPKSISMITPDTFIEVEEKQLLKTQASSKPGAIAAIPGSDFTTGIRFRVIAYRADNGAYQTHQDYIVGQAYAPLILNAGMEYVLVAYSAGSMGFVPNLMVVNGNSNVNTDLISSGGTEAFVYQRLNYTPVAGNNNVDLVLRHEYTSITSTVYNYIPEKEMAELLVTYPGYQNVTYGLSTGKISSYSGTSIPAQVWSGSNTREVTFNNPQVIHNNTSVTGLKNSQVWIKWNGNTSYSVYSAVMNIKPEYKQHFNIGIKRCGAYLGPNNTMWKEFMCHNLGANTNADPFIPAGTIHGAKYSWGAQTNEAGRYVSQANDQGNSGAIAGWDSTAKADGSWSDTNKTANDPCPTGYRLPTTAEWQAVIDNNNIERVGTWTHDGNFVTALYIKNSAGQRTLMLPAAGRRFGSDGSLYSPGDFGYYWSSSYGISPVAGTLVFGSTSISTTNGNRTNALSVRCIAE